MKRGKTSALAMIAVILGAVGLGAGAYSVISIQTGAVKGDDGDDGDDGIVLYVKEKEDLIPRVLVYMTSSQGIGMSKEIIDFDTKEYDTINAFNLTSDNYTIPSDGYYYIHASITLVNTNDGSYYYIYIGIDGTDKLTSYEHASLSGALTLTVGATLLLNKTNQITCSVDSNDNSYDVLGNPTFLTSYLEIEKKP